MDPQHWIADLHQYDDEQDPDPRNSESSESDRLQSKKNFLNADPDSHKSNADRQGLIATCTVYS